MWSFALRPYGRLAAALLLLGCGGGSDAPPAPRSPSGPRAACVADPGAHALAEARALYGELEPEDASVEPFRPSQGGREPAPPQDLDGDGRPEIDVSFPDQYGAYSRRRWLYSSGGECRRLLGALEESYVWVGPERHAGVADLLVLLGGEGEIDPSSGAGVMTRLEHDGSGYVPRETVRCASLLDVPVPRDERCPGTWGRPGRWAESGAWRQGAPRRTFTPDRCLVPEDDAGRQTGERAPERTVLADLDADGERDVVFSAGEEGCGSGGCEQHVYVSHHGCPQYAGSVFGAPARYDAARRELRAYEAAGVCDGGEGRGVVAAYRLEGTRLVSARRVDCPCLGEGARSPECE